MALLLAGGAAGGAACAAEPAAADRDAALGAYMRAWWSVAGAAVGAPLPLAAYALPQL